jgi:hypothetical protein
MTPKEMRYVWETVEKEGFEYAFVDYSDFQEIKDEEFHKLREAYLAERKKFADYLGLGD